MDPEELVKQGWMDPVESVRGLEWPMGLKIPLLEMDMSRVKSKEIGRCQKWSLLEWARMNPRELG